MKNRCAHLVTLFICSIFHQIAAQNATLDGYVFENFNRGYLNQVQITVFRLPENTVVGEVLTDQEGHFDLQVADGKTYRIFTKKDIFFEKNDTVQVENGRGFVKIELRRKPGYLFDVTLAELRENPDQVVDGIQGATIEIFNRTTQKSELVLKNHPNPGFQFTFEQGNKYTVMIRKNGYLTRRIEANVAVEGCILCIDGVNDLRPGVTDILTQGNSMGTLLANLDLEKANLNRRIALKNIYYDYDKSFIRPEAAKELDKAVVLLQDNPGIKVELGSHTDARGSDIYNASLSQRRAESAVKYIVEHGVDSARIAAKGYGESQLVNRCGNAANCSETEHQLNRRTELKITGTLDDPRLFVENQPSLEEMIREEEFSKQMKSLEGQKEYRSSETTPKKGEIVPENATKNPQIDFKKSDKTIISEKAIEVMVVEKPSGVGGNFAENFTGYAVEILRSDLELAATDGIFTQNKDVFVQKDLENMFCYFIGANKSLPRTRNFYLSDPIKKYPAARLVVFADGVKTYIK